MAGRKRAHIDWKEVDEMLEAGCTGVEVAASLGIDPLTLYRHTQEDHKINFEAYRQQKIAVGDKILRKKLYYKAKENGDTVALIFLAKTRLNMAETQKMVHDIGDSFQSTSINIQFRPRAASASNEGLESQKEEQ